MKRILTSLTFKISMIIILTEIIVLGIAGSVYLNRFSNEIDRSIQGKIQLPGKLINAGLLNLASLTNRTTMNQLVGEELIEGLAISRDLSVFAAINPDLRGQKIQDLPEIDSGLFDFANPRHKIFKAKDYIVDVTPVFHPGQSIPRFFVYIKMGTTSSETEKAGIKRLFFFGSFATVLLTTLIIILSFKLSVFNRITSLLNVLSQVAGGDLSIRTTPGKNPDEIGTLQQGINVMITDLQEIVGSLEQRVQERTIELKDNQDRFAALLESAPDAMVVSNSNGEIVLVNSQTERLFGYDRTELLGYPVELLVPDSKREFHPSHRKQYLADAKIRQMGAVGMELFAQAKNGSLIPVDISLSPIESESGILVVASIRDITERKRVEADIKKLSAAVEQSPASVVITDLNGTIEYVNSRFCEVTGYTSQEAIDQNPRILKSDTHSPELYKKLWETISAGKEWRGEFLNKKKTGELYWESASISPIKSTDGSITHYLAVKEDITNRKAIEDALKKSEERFSLTTAGSGDGLWDFDLPAEFFGTPTGLGSFWATIMRMTTPINLNPGVMDCTRRIVRPL